MTLKTPLPTISRLCEAFSYDVTTGLFWWKIKLGKSKVGKLAGRRNHEGYWTLKLDGKGMMGHRVAWLLCTGAWPEDSIDHINGVRDDNRFENLRECSRLENMQNYPTPASNSSGFVGVYWNSTAKKWTAQIRVGQGRGDRTRITIGYFDKLEDAAAAHAKKKAELHLFNPVTRDGIHANKAA